MIWLLLATGTIALGAYAIPKLLNRIITWGGDRTDGLGAAAKFMTESNVFRGSVSPDDPFWDGNNRIAPPTQEGG